VDFPLHFAQMDLANVETKLKDLQTQLLLERDRAIQRKLLLRPRQLLFNLKVFVHGIIKLVSLLLYAQMDLANVETKLKDFLMQLLLERDHVIQLNLSLRL